MKVYTKGGDKGRTSLIGGERVDKFDPRVEAYGTVDELSASVAYLYDSISAREQLKGKMARQREELITIVERLMRLGALLAADEKWIEKLPPLVKEDVEALEKGIDHMSQRDNSSFSFTLPVGDQLISYSHVARTICRRAERLTIKSAQIHPTPPICREYLNRLSDYLYTISIELGLELGIEPIIWKP